MSQEAVAFLHPFQVWLADPPNSDLEAVAFPHPFQVWSADLSDHHYLQKPPLGNPDIPGGWGQGSGGRGLPPPIPGVVGCPPKSPPLPLGLPDLGTHGLSGPGLPSFQGSTPDVFSNSEDNGLANEIRDALSRSFSLSPLPCREGCGPSTLVSGLPRDFSDRSAKSSLSSRVSSWCSPYQRSLS